MIESITTSAVTVWLVVGVLTLLLFIAAANDSFAAAFWVTAIGLCTLQFVTISNPWGWVANNPRTSLVVLLVYLPIGIGWSLFRWYKLLQKEIARLRAYKADFKAGSVWSTWESYVENQKPIANRHKDEIVFWIAYWPFSMLAYLILDFLTELGNWMYTKLSGVYQAMADDATKDL